MSRSLDRYTETFGDLQRFIPKGDQAGMCEICSWPFAWSEGGDLCPSCEHLCEKCVDHYRDEEGKPCRSCDKPRPFPRIWLRPSWLILTSAGWSGGFGPEGNEFPAWWTDTPEGDRPTLYATRKAATAELDQDERVVKVHKMEDGGLYFPDWCEAISLEDLLISAGRK